jgi:hypothetical protein
MAMHSLTEALIARAPNRRLLTGDSVVNCGHSFPVCTGRRRGVRRNLMLSYLTQWVG